MIDYKPLGTIVKVNGGDKKFMIIGRAISVPLKEGEGLKMFDYSAVLYPEGVGNRNVYFQDSDISEVVFTGYSDEEETTVMDKIKEFLEKTDIQRASKEDYNRKPNS
jgi:hypothetical protein